MSLPFRTVLTLLSLATPLAAAQPCSPHWDPAIGSPGLTSDGYVGPMTSWDDGRGDALFAGGSFTSMGGYVTPGIARYDPITATWGDVGGGVYSQFTNSFLAAITPCTLNGQSELAVGGQFDRAGGQPISFLAAWNGQRWRSIVSDSGGVSGAVWAITPFQNKLFVGGGFATAAGLTVNGIAAFDGNSWTGAGTGITGPFSPSLFALKVYNDGSGEKLYAGGRVASIGGVNGLIARWTGSVWQPIGGGLRGADQFSDVEAMTVFNDGSGNALYVAGWSIRTTGLTTCSVAKWNGSTWTRIGADMGGRTTSLAVFDDGTGPALYAAGTAQPNTHYVAKWTGSAWQTLDGGIGGPDGPPWPSVFGMTTWRNQLIVGGEFAWAGANQIPSSGIVARTSCLNFCPADFNGDGFLDFFDFSAFVDCFDGVACPAGRSADFNADGFIDFFDFSGFVDAFEAGC